MVKEKIRNFGRFLGVYLIAIILTVIGIFSFSSCKDTSLIPNKQSTVDSVSVAQQIESIVNPTFNSVQEIILFKQQTEEGFAIDSIFEAMPEQVINNVASVLFKKQLSITKKDLVKEYRANKAIYDNLPSDSSKPANAPQEVDLNSTDLGNKRSGSAISTSYRYRTDTVDGVAKKVQIKTEESYVE